jgi:hypothetical protein
VLTGFATLLSIVQMQERVSGVSEAVGDGAASHGAPYELLKRRIYGYRRSSMSITF